MMITFLAGESLKARLALADEAVPALVADASVSADSVVATVAGV